MTDQLPPSLQRFATAYATAVRDELRPTAARHARVTPAGPRRPHSRTLAGAALGLAGIAAAIVVTLGPSATPPAYAVTRHSDGSVSVQLQAGSGLLGANRQLAEMGLHEGISIQVASGAAPVAGPVQCVPVTSGAGQPATPVSAYVGSDNTAVVPAGDNTGAGNTGTGGAGTTYHLASCTVHASDLTPSRIGTMHRDGRYIIVNEG